MKTTCGGSGGMAESFRHKRHFRHLRNYEWSIDFQGERMLEAISADFLRWAEKVSAGSP